MKIKIMQRSVYHKYAQVEVEVPNDWNNKDGVENYYDEHLNDYLNDNEHLYVDKIDKAISESNLQFGSGIEEYRGMCEIEADSEWRYELEDGYGGHL